MWFVGQHIGWSVGRLVGWLQVRDEILRECPASIRMKIQKHVFSKWVNTPYLFQGTSQVFRVRGERRRGRPLLLPILTPLPLLFSPVPRTS